MSKAPFWIGPVTVEILPPPRSKSDVMRQVAGLRDIPIIEIGLRHPTPTTVIDVAYEPALLAGHPDDHR